MADPKTPTPTTSISKKYADTVNKATGAAADNGDDIKGGAMVISEASAMFVPFSYEEMQAKARSGAFEFAPQMGQIKRGQQITAYLDGEGPGNDFENEKTHEVRHVKSWILSDPNSGLRISILSSAQLDKKLPPFVGSLVTIARAAEDIELKGGFRCADYMVFGPKLEKPRTFSTPTQHVLPAGSDVIDVPATTSNHANA